MFVFLTAVLFTLLAVDIIITFILLYKYTSSFETSNKASLVIVYGAVVIPIVLSVLYMWCIFAYYSV